MLSHCLRLSHLTLAVAILDVGQVSIGTRTSRSGLHDQVDRRGRREVSIFQIGKRYLKHCLTNALAYQIPLYPFRKKLSGVKKESFNKAA